MRTEKRFSIVHLTATNPAEAGLPFEPTKNAVLGKSFSLELIFVNETQSRNLNRIYRGKNKPANVLAFPLARREGQIVICSRYANRQAAGFGRSKKDFIGYLFIHGLLHLKGYHHGSTMEQKENEFCSQFLEKTKSPYFVHGKKDIRRNRHRHIPGKGHGRRERARR